MRRMEIFCASPASTAICSSTDQRSMVRRGHRPIDRHLHHHDQYLRRKPLPLPHTPCSSHLPITPRPHNLSEKSTRKSTSTSSAAKHTSSDSRRKSSADVYDLARISHRPQPGDSARYLLSDNDDNNNSNNNNSVTSATHFIEWHKSTADNNIVPKLPPILVRRHQSAKEPRHLMLVANHDSPKLVKSCSTSRCRDQVVVLRVSLHCKGCEGKVRKHISKMEGVTSFSIDFEAKKVTIIGNVTPSGVLASVSRVKNAQLWPSPPSSGSSSSSSSSSSLSSSAAATPTLSWSS